MKKIIIICGILSFTSAFCQDDEVVEYSLIYDEPDKSWVGGGISYDMSLNEYNMTIAALGVEGRFFHELFAIDAGFKFHLLENAADFAYLSPYATSIYEPEKSRDFNLLGTYYFKQDTEKKKATVRLKKVGNTIYVVEVPAKRSVKFGAELGYDAGVTYYNFQNNQMTGIDSQGNEVLIESGNGLGKSVATFYKYSMIRLGASRTRSMNMQITTAKYGDRTVASSSRIYTQIFIGFGQSVDDIYVPFDAFINLQEEPYTRYDINTNLPFRKIGGCIGYQNYSLGNFGFGYGAEIGMLPAPKNKLRTSFYLDLTLRYQIGKKL